MLAAMLDPGKHETAAAAAESLDLRGVKCPLNWARAKVRLEQLAPGASLELVLDDPKGARDIPRAAEAEGYDVVEAGEGGGVWRLRIAR
jgi:tRNA 2-thiouridine synthesizing protein A